MSPDAAATMAQIVPVFFLAIAIDAKIHQAFNDAELPRLAKWFAVAAYVTLICTEVTLMAYVMMDRDSGVWLFILTVVGVLLAVAVLTMPLIRSLIRGKNDGDSATYNNNSQEVVIHADIVNLNDPARIISSERDRDES
ncbi:hypothetical protein ACQEVI_23765 [Promicromonospora sp. CA-289599]|uniref:hypothetical protein n=1 Tax=Promicromonospora sp. CA-289599 TaxID=3240014 RepID=UPI003D8F9320